MVVVRTRQIQDQILCAFAMATISKLLAKVETTSLCGVYNFIADVGMLEGGHVDEG